MTPADLRATLTLIAELWPKADWPKPLAEETSRRMVGLKLDAAQARAALVNLRASMKWKTIEPCEILEALGKAAANTSQSTVGKGTAEAEAKRLKAHRERDPNGFALVQIDAHVTLGLRLHHAQTPSAYGRIRGACTWMLDRLDQPDAYTPSPDARLRHDLFRRIVAGYGGIHNLRGGEADAAILRALTYDHPAMLAWLDEQGFPDPLVN